MKLGILFGLMGLVQVSFSQVIPIPAIGTVVSSQCSVQNESNFSLVKFCESYISGIKNVRMFEFQYNNRLVAYPVVSQEIVPSSFDTGFTTVKYTLFSGTATVGTVLSATTFEISVLYENKPQKISIVSAEGRISGSYYFKAVNFQSVVNSN